MAGRIPQGFIDDLLARTDIVELISSRIQLKRTGSNYSGLCPFHDEKSPSFSVSPDKQFYYCFGCRATGNALRFVMEYDRMDFPAAVETLAHRAGVSIPEERSSPAEDERNRRRAAVFEALTAASEFYRESLRRHPSRNSAVDYLKGRGVSGEIARDFHIGFAPPGWTHLEAALDQPRDVLIEAGLLVHHPEDNRSYDRFRDRIIFPIRDLRGRVIAFGGRILGDGTPKYLNSPETPVFHKGRELYGLYELRQFCRDVSRVLVVEGYMDVVALAQYGIRYAVATLGTATTAPHLERLFRMVNEVVFCFDGDNAGVAAAWKALGECLPLLHDGRSARFLFLPTGEDPDTLVRQRGQDGFEDLIDNALHLPDYYFGKLSEGLDLDSIDDRARLSKVAMPGIQRLPEGVFKALMVDELARRTGLSAERLLGVTRVEGGVPPPFPEAPRHEFKATISSDFTDRALSILLQQPELGAGLDPDQWQRLESVGGCRLLVAVLRIISTDEAPSTPLLLDHFRGSADAEHLNQLVQAQHLLSPEALAREFDGLMERIFKESETQIIQEFKSALLIKPFKSLTEEEKRLVREWTTRPAG